MSAALVKSYDNLLQKIAPVTKKSSLEMPTEILLTRNGRIVYWLILIWDRESEIKSHGNITSLFTCF